MCNETLHMLQVGLMKKGKLSNEGDSALTLLLA